MSFRNRFPAFAIASALAFSAASLPVVAGQTAADSLAWRLVGPFRGGWATVVAGVPSKPDTFYFGAAGGGVWRSDDAGQTWVSMFDSGPAAIGALSVSASNPNVIYVGTGQAETRYDVAAGSGLFKSTDGGKTWRSLGFADTRHIAKIWVDPANPDLVLVGVQGHFFGPSKTRGVYRSTDGGKSWTQVLKPDNDWTGATDIAGDPADPHVVFASTWEAHQYPWQSYFTPTIGKGSGIYKSTDEGKTWKRIAGNGWPQGALGRIGLAVAHTAKATRVYATIDSEKSGGLYRSDDGGAHWARVNKERAFANSYSSRLTVQPNDPDVVYTVGQSIRRCAKGGAQCDIVKGAPGGDDYHHIWINPLHPDHIITGSDQGAVVSVDGWKSWSSWYNQPTGQFYHLATDNKFPYWIYSGQQDSGTVAIASRSDYGAITWRDWHPVGGDERDYDIPDPRDPEIVYDSGLGGGVTRFDGHTGQTANIAPWPESAYGKRPTLVRYHYLWATSLVASRAGPFALYLGSQVLFRTGDGGRHWGTISGDLTGKTGNAKDCERDPLSLAQAKLCGYGSISAIAPSPHAAGEIWVGTDDGLLWITRDGGKHWADITPQSVPLWAKFACVDISSLANGTVYAAIDMHRLDNFAPHVLVTRDYGKTWRDISANLPRDHFVDVVRSDPVKAGLLFAGTDIGVFVSFDDGGHWSPLGGKLPTAWITDLLVHGDDLIAATEGRAIWSLDDIAPLRESSLPAAEAHLFQPAIAWRVHANNNNDTPLPPETPQSLNPPAGAPIDYWLAHDAKGPVSLEIYDAPGALVRRFASDAKPEHLNARRYFASGWLESPERLPATAGFHRFDWNLRYERPPAAKYGFDIAAVWGAGTPIKPEGAWALPGVYKVVLKANGRAYTTQLLVREDPRLKVSEADLKASRDFSKEIAGALARTRQGSAETRSVKKQVDALVPEGNAKDPLQGLAAPLRRKTDPHETTFESVDGTLTGLETNLEAADVAPTTVQRAVFAEALTKLAGVERDWSRLKSGALSALNAMLLRSHRKVVTIPSYVASEEAADAGQEIP